MATKPVLSEEITPKPESSPALDGVTDKFLDGTSHLGIAVKLSTGKGQSTLVIPDANAGEPVLITKPIVLVGSNLKKFLKAKQVDVPDALGRLIDDAEVGCQAFYYSKTVMLLLFTITFNKGVLTSLTDEPSLGELFDIKGASLRVIKCPKASLDVLQKYVAGLSAESA